MELRLIRDRALSSKVGEYGRLLIDGAFFAAICEQPWNDNRKGKSCIPEGTYRLLHFDSPAHGQTVVFHNPALNIYGTPDLIPPGVDGRSLCEIHNANWPFQLKGCVAVGHQLADIAPHGLGVNASVSTFQKLIGRIGRVRELTAVITSA